MFFNDIDENVTEIRFDKFSFDLAGVRFVKQCRLSVIII